MAWLATCAGCTWVELYWTSVGTESTMRMSFKRNWLYSVTLCLGRAELDSDLQVAVGSVQDPRETILHHMLIIRANNKWSKENTTLLEIKRGKILSSLNLDVIGSWTLDLQYSSYIKSLLFCYWKSNRDILFKQRYKDRKHPPMRTTTTWLNTIVLTRRDCTTFLNLKHLNGF